ncbi:MAG TPA: hypothetical protein VG711_05365, partial [Phycisphaerales bacterium]|nr:hypothetical protein [Phycisphaerales bacterium]
WLRGCGPISLKMNRAKAISKESQGEENASGARAREVAKRLNEEGGRHKSKNAGPANESMTMAEETHAGGAEETLDDVQNLLEEFQQEASAANEEDVAQVIAAVEQHLEDGSDAGAAKADAHAGMGMHSAGPSEPQIHDDLDSEVTFEPPAPLAAQAETQVRKPQPETAVATLEGPVEADIAAETGLQESDANEGSQETQMTAAEVEIPVEQTIEEVDKAIVKEIDSIVSEGASAVEEVINSPGALTQAANAGETVESSGADGEMPTDAVIKGADAEAEAPVAQTGEHIEEGAITNAPDATATAANEIGDNTQNEPVAQENTEDGEQEASNETFEAVSSSDTTVTGSDVPADACETKMELVKGGAQTTGASAVEDAGSTSAQAANEDTKDTSGAEPSPTPAENKAVEKPKESGAQKPAAEKKKEPTVRAAPKTPALAKMGVAMQEGVVTVLAGVNAPLRKVPQQLLPVMNWAAISLLVWVPVVWLMVWRADAQMKEQHEKADFVEAGMVDPKPVEAAPEHGESGHAEGGESGHGGGHEAKPKKKPKEKKSAGHGAKKSEGHGEE